MGEIYSRAIDDKPARGRTAKVARIGAQTGLAPPMNDTDEALGDNAGALAVCFYFEM